MAAVYPNNPSHVSPLFYRPYSSPTTSSPSVYRPPYDSQNRASETAQTALTAPMCSPSPPLAGKISPTRAREEQEPTLEEKIKLYDLLKKAKPDPFFPVHKDIEDIVEIAEEFKNGGFRDPTKLQEISSLHLFGNDLTELPSSIRLLKGLRILDLINNRLQTLPKELKELRQLGCLKLQGNLFEEVPAVIIEMVKDKRIATLHLGDNPKLKKIPLSILPPNVRSLQKPDYVDYYEE